MNRFIPLLLLLSLLVRPATAEIRQLDVRHDPVFIRVQGLPRPTSMKPSSIARRAVVREFLKAHPNFDIEAFSMPDMGVASAMDSGPLMAIAAGVPPHCIYVKAILEKPADQQDLNTLSESGLKLLSNLSRTQ